MRELNADLHIHSYCSDGTDSPRSILDKLIDEQISIFSITDHDSLDAYDQIADVRNMKQLICIPGVEISSIYMKRNIHVLGYGVTKENNAIPEICKYNRDMYELKDKRYIENLKNAGFQVDVGQYDRYINDRQRGGWKALNYLIDIGICNNIEEFLEKYATEEYLPMAELHETCHVISSILQCNGIPVLAHPGEYVHDAEELDVFLNQFLEMGIQGVECFSPYNTHEVSEKCVAFCKKNNLCITGGSDYHGHLSRRKRNRLFPIGTSCLDLERIMESCKVKI